MAPEALPPLHLPALPVPSLLLLAVLLLWAGPFPAAAAAAYTSAAAGSAAAAAAHAPVTAFAAVALSMLLQHMGYCVGQLQVVRLKDIALYVPASGMTQACKWGGLYCGGARTAGLASVLVYTALFATPPANTDKQRTVWIVRSSKGSTGAHFADSASV